MPQSTLLKIARTITFTLLVVLAPCALTAQSQPTPTSGAQGNGSARIKWGGKPKISRYRLQVARDEQFSDIIFDKLVQGYEHNVTDIAPGRYYWRVAPAAGETGAYSKPLPVTFSLKGESVSAPDVQQPKFLMPPNDVGWRTATGLVAQPVTAKLRAGSNLDLLGVNAYGMVYAINGENGVSLWSARFRPDAKKGEPVNSDGTQPFTPLLIDAKGDTTQVLVAFDSGVRLLDGGSGREVWRAALGGDATNGLVLKGEGGASSLVVFDSSRTLSFIKSDTGKVAAQIKLDGYLVGQPVAFKLNNESGVLLALNNGTLDVRNLAGESLDSIRLDAAITTAPLLMRGASGQLVMLGTESGLVALNAADLNPLWRVATESDAPHGSLGAADLDKDGADEVVFITRRGRTVAVNAATGKIKWFAEGATDAAQAAFADVNGDGAMDVLVAGGSAFALGYSGRDGTLIWKAEEAAARGEKTEGALTRSLVAAAVGKNSPPLLVGTDSGRTGLRAVGLPAGSLK
ncbi:MAG: PQQ-binding-like beta-propeller repeat protein [Pyrinomonadaceae bacterium]|nr:PQQ-binding-like beta-propeller repeat protein [Pyrinomonadaceae bacterium]